MAFEKFYTLTISFSLQILGTRFKKNYSYNCVYRKLLLINYLRKCFVRIHSTPTYSLNIMVAPRIITEQLMANKFLLGFQVIIFVIPKHFWNISI